MLSSEYFGYLICWTFLFQWNIGIIRLKNLPEDYWWNITIIMNHFLLLACYFNSMLAALNIFLFVFLSIGNSIQNPVFQNGYASGYFSPCFCQFYKNNETEADYPSDQIKYIVLTEESFSSDDSDNSLYFKLLFLINHLNLFCKELQILKKIQFHFTHVSFLELDLPPPVFSFIRIMNCSQ